MSAETWRCFCGRAQPPKFDKLGRPFISCPCSCRFFIKSPLGLGGMMLFARMVEAIEAQMPGDWESRVFAVLSDARAKNARRSLAGVEAPAVPATAG